MGEKVKWGDLFDITEKQLSGSVFGKDIKNGRTIYVINIIVSIEVWYSADTVN